MSSLLEEYAKAKLAYDELLEEAYVRGEKVTDEKARLYARRHLAMKGLRDPDVIRWEIRFRIGMVEINGEE